MLSEVTAKAWRNRVLTRENAGNYSAGMQAELDALESKLALMLERYRSMRDETLKLRQQVVSLESNNKHLSDKLEAARVRTEALYNKIPD
jgi:cell division protein ZapB